MRIVIAVVFAAVAMGLSLRTTEFAAYQREFGKSYAPAEEKFRATVFEENLKKIKAHNSLGLPWTYGINSMTDLTEEEFKHMLNGRARDLDTRIERLPPVNREAPERVDWRERGAVTDVKDQGAMGASWAISTTGTVEGAFFVKSGNLVGLSDNQLVDCVKEKERDASTILPYVALDYVQEHGLCAASDYPSPSTGECRDHLCKVVAKSTGKVMLPQRDEEALKNAIALTPVSVLLDATELMFYKSGIVGKCGNTVNHAALIVGYDSQNGVDYYIVKNSWGASWGEKGYCRIQRNTGGMGMCSITASSVYPTFD